MCEFFLFISAKLYSYFHIWLILQLFGSKLWQFGIVGQVSDVAPWPLFLLPASPAPCIFQIHTTWGLLSVTISGSASEMCIYLSFNQEQNKRRFLNIIIILNDQNLCLSNIQYRPDPPNRKHTPNQFCNQNISLFIYIFSCNIPVS